MPEVIPLGYLLTLLQNKSCGYPLPVAEVRIVDSETKRILGTGERGEIQARGQTVMKGYLNDESE